MIIYILAGALVITLLLGVAFILNRLKIAGVSEAIVVSGARQNGEVKVIPPGGKTFVLPVIQKASSLSLLQKKVELLVDAVDINKVPVQVRAVAMIKIGSAPELIRAAAERFTAQEEDIVINAQEVLLGSLRTIIGQMTVTDLITARDVLASKVTENTNSELEVIGLRLDSLQVSEISDTGNYIRNLGIPEAERVQKEARIAKAQADRDSNDAEVDARTKIAEKNRELAVREAQLKAETDQASAISDASGPLAKAQQDELIAQREQGVAEQQAMLREKQLDYEVRKPADARLYDVQKDAEADKARQVADAQAEAESIKLKGEADAEAIRLRGEAEADALMKRAEALKQFNEAAVLELIINKLPEVAHELAAPMGNIEGMTVISTDGAGAIPRTVANNFAQLDGILKGFTGASLSEMVASKLDVSKPDSSPEEPGALVTPEV